ncbi:MAG TPA: MFS transporter [Acidimicrobiales bacterium]
MDERVDERERLLTPAFVEITGAALCYFVAIGVVAPVLPRFVEDSLGGGGTAVGLSVGAFAVSAALLRPVVGRIGDRHGRRVLVLAGAGIAGVSVLGYALATNLAVLIFMRLLTGVGEAAMFVGAATAVQDIAPSARRGEATSYFSVAVYGGLAIGPILGEIARTHWGIHAAWYLGAAFCFAAVLLGTRMPAARPVVDDQPTDTRRRFFHPAAIRPGLILALSTTGYAGFAAFVPLYVTQLGLSGSGVVFAEYAFAILAVRIFGARLPDQLGSRRSASIALVLQASGLAVMCLWMSTTGLYVSTFVYAMGVSLLYPALFPLVVDAAPEAERSQAIATFTLAFDVSQGLGAFVLGIVVSLSSERWAFGAASLLSLAALVIVRTTGREFHRAGQLSPAVTP